MNENDLLKIIIPAATVSGPSGPIATAVFHLEKEDDNWYLVGAINGTKEGDLTEKVLLETEDIIDVLDGTLDVDQYCQDETFRNHQVDLARRLGAKMGPEHCGMHWKP